MNPKDTLQSKELKKMKPGDFIYLGVILLFFIITAILFFFSTNFIVENINKIFKPVETTTTESLNMVNYLIVEKKLNLPINKPRDNQFTNIPTEIPITPTIIIPPIETVTPIITTLDKKSISINILNGSKKAGVASSLSNNLENAGFSKASTGDNPTVYPVTTILIKDSKKEYTSSIQTVVKKSYPKAITKINPETSNFDVVIITGK